MTSDTYGAFCMNQRVAHLLMVPMITNTDMNPADTERLTFSALATEVRSAPGRRFSMPRK